MSAASRLQMDAFWRMVKFLLGGVVFLLVGLQLRGARRRLDDRPGHGRSRSTAVVLATVIVARFVWMFPATYLARLDPAGPPARPGARRWPCRR